MDEALAGNAAHRVFAINDHAANARLGFKGNRVVSSKYTWYSFIPKNLFEQFMRIANAYFLLIAVLQQIPQLSPYGKGTGIITLSVVLVVSAVKEAWEDIKRHRADSSVNNSIALVLKGENFVKIRWEEVRVGDMVKVENRVPFPADLLLLSSSEPLGMCYIETASLDGETNLKIRQAIPETAECLDIKTLRSLKGFVVCEKPNRDLYNFEGRIELSEGRHSLSNRQMLLRGSVLRNTGWIYGLVVFTGHDSKLMMNSQKVRLKQSRIEKMLNKLIPMIFIMQLIVCIVCAILGHDWFRRNVGSINYLDITVVPPSSQVVIDMFSFLILFASFIPISLYVSIETCKFGQAALIAADLDMYHAPSDTACVARTSSLNEELGQVEYVFTDKTGTLTCNQMDFAKVSIRGVAYGANTSKLERLHKAAVPTGAAAAAGASTSAGAAADKSKRESKRESVTARKLAHDLRMNSEYDSADSMEGIQLASMSYDRTYYSYSSSSEEIVIAPPRPKSRSMSNAPPPAESLPIRAGTKTPHVTLQDEDWRLCEDISSNDEERRRSIDAFFTLLAVCHTVVPEEAPDRSIIYQAASPDENALVYGAKAFGFYFHTRTPQGITVSVHGRPRQYQVLNINEFTSARKRMSVVVRGPDNRLYVMLKGADNMVFPRLRAPNSAETEALMRVTQAHLDSYAADGLRTLVLAMREVSSSFYEPWHERYMEAMNTLENRTEKLAAVADEIEFELELVGATAIDDKLQDGVPQTISTLREAGMRVWMLTGDKQETAINIGYSCALVMPHMALLVVNEGTMEDASNRLDALLLEAIEHRRDGREMACVVDGHTLGFVLHDARDWEQTRLETKLLDLCQQCKSVIACRVSPLQKAQVVELVQRHLNPVSLAIGDGGNDVPMIRTASLGIGISGEEGLQAARAADYSIAQFRFLQKLLLVHGHWCYARISKLILYSIYKNFAVNLVPFWFAFVNGFSGQTFVEKWTMAMYNTLFTAVPVVVVGLFEQVLSADMLLSHPKLYKTGPKNEFFNRKPFFGWIFWALVHSFTFYYFVLAVQKWGIVYANGQSADLFVNGSVIMTVIILTVTYKLALETTHWTYVNVAANAGSVALVLFWMVVWNYMDHVTGAAGDYAGIGMATFRDPTFYFVLIVAPVVALLPDFVLKYIMFQFFPSPHDRARKAMFDPRASAHREVAAANRDHEASEAAARAAPAQDDARPQSI